MRDAEPQSLDWALWFFWIMATTTGWVLGRILVSGLPLVASGVAIAGLQWAVLYRRIRKAWQWAILSSVAWIAGYIIFILFIPPGLDVFAGPLMGGILGFAQWGCIDRTGSGDPVPLCSQEDHEELISLNQARRIVNGQ
jgi:hypothetical protein